MSVRTGQKESFVSRVSPGVMAMPRQVRDVADVTATTMVMKHAAFVTLLQENVYAKIILRV